jgi:hypothetical protein
MSKRKKGKPEWIKETIEIDKNHGWRSKSGYKIFVAGRGAVRFDVPQNWLFEPKDNSFAFRDAEPPDDDCCLEVSYNHLPEHDWTLFPLVHTVKKIAESDSRDVIERGEIIKLKRQTAQIVWTELKFMDHQDGDREAFSRICVGIGSRIQCLITFEFWADQAEQMTPVWDEVMNSLVLGLYISDPKTGFARPD